QHAITHSLMLANTMPEPIEASSPQELVTLLLTPDVDPVQAALALRKLAEDESVGGSPLVAILVASADRLSDADPAVLGGLLRLIHVRVLRALAAGDEDSLGSLQSEWLVQIIAGLSPQVANRHLLMQ